MGSNLKAVGAWVRRIFTINSFCINGLVSFIYHWSQYGAVLFTAVLCRYHHRQTHTLMDSFLTVSVTMGTGKPIRKMRKGYNLIGSSCLPVLFYKVPSHHSRSADKLWICVCVCSQGAAITCYRDGVGHWHVLPPTPGQSHEILSKTTGTVIDCAALHTVLQNSWRNNECLRLTEIFRTGMNSVTAAGSAFHWRPDNTNTKRCVLCSLRQDW